MPGKKKKRAEERKAKEESAAASVAAAAAEAAAAAASEGGAGAAGGGAAAAMPKQLITGIDVRKALRISQSNLQKQSQDFRKLIELGKDCGAIPKDYESKF